MPDSIKQMADKILADGLAEFIGDGLVVEIATKNLPPDNTCSLPPSDFPTAKPIGPIAGSLGGWNEYKVIRPTKAVRAPKSIDYGDGLPGLPGSAERIEAMRARYDATVNELAARSEESAKQNREVWPVNDVSAFSMTSEQLADRFAALGLDWRVNEAGEYEAYRIESSDTIETPRRRRIRKKLSE